MVPKERRPSRVVLRQQHARAGKGVGCRVQIQRQGEAELGDPAACAERGCMHSPNEGKHRENTRSNTNETRHATIWCQQPDPPLRCEAAGGEPLISSAIILSLRVRVCVYSRPSGARPRGTSR